MSDDSRGTSTQSIINSTERDSEERSVVNDSKRKSVHSNWSDLVLIDMEAEYWRIYNSRKRPDAEHVLLLCWLLLLPKLLQYLPLPQLLIRQLKT